MTTITMNAIGTTFDFQTTDGKNLGEVVEGMEWVRISEKKVGKGKGKTISAISVPSIQSVNPIYLDALSTARKEMLTNLYRAGKKQLGVDEVGEESVIRWYAAQSFSAESIGNWFDTEMGEYLEMNICTVKGWEMDSMDAAQQKYVNTKCAAYKAAFLECAAKFPKLAPEQKKELIRVITINELSGGIVDRIMDKLAVKEVKVEESLGF